MGKLMEDKAYFSKVCLCRRYSDLLSGDNGGCLAPGMGEGGVHLYKGKCMPCFYTERGRPSVPPVY